MAQLHIVITDPALPGSTAEARILAPLNARLTVAQCRTEDDVLAVAREADALIVGFAPITRRVIEGLSRCQFISRYGIGLDMIDLEAARDHKIPVRNVPGFCTEEVASHTLGFLVSLGRKINVQDRLMHEAGAWQMLEHIRPVERFRGQTLGLVALGRIARKVAELTKPLGLRIIGYDVQPPQGLTEVEVVDFDTVVREADYLSLHCPLTPQTRHMINAEVLKKMKPTAFLINVARGGVVDTPALVEALKHKVIAGAALDVFEEEPLPADHPLRMMKNVILTAHAAAYSSMAAIQLVEDAARNVLEFFQTRSS